MKTDFVGLRIISTFSMKFLCFQFYDQYLIMLCSDTFNFILYASCCKTVEAEIFLCKLQVKLCGNAYLIGGITTNYYVMS